jgi:flagellar protein FlgJ
MEMNIATIGKVDGGAQLAATQKSGRMPAAGEAAAAKKVAKDFEALFVGMMLKSMRETTGKDKLTDGGHGEEMYHSLLDQEYAKALTERGGVGLAAMFEQQIGKSQGMNQYDKTNQQTKIEVNHENR